MLQESECLPVCCGTCVCLHCQLPCQTVSHHCKSAHCQSLISLKQLSTLYKLHTIVSLHTVNPLMSLKQFSTLCKLHTIVSLHTVNQWCPSNNSLLCKLHTIVSLRDLQWWETCSDVKLAREQSCLRDISEQSLLRAVYTLLSTMTVHWCLSDNSALLQVSHHCKSAHWQPIVVCQTTLLSCCQQSLHFLNLYCTSCNEAGRRGGGALYWNCHAPVSRLRLSPDSVLIWTNINLL